MEGSYSQTFRMSRLFMYIINLAALFTTIHLDANHLQMTYYLLVLLAAVGTSELRTDFLKAKSNPHYHVITSSLLIVAVFFALLPPAPN